MTFSVTGRHFGTKPIGILTHPGHSPREALRFAADLERAGMIVTIQDDDTGNPVGKDALTVLADSIDDPSRTEW